MYPYIYKYFVVNKRLNIPGVGTLFIKAQPAKLDFVERVLHAPSYTVQLDTQATGAEKKLYQYLAAALQINEWEAVNQFQQFTEQLLEEVENNGSASLKGIGILRKSASTGFYLDAESFGRATLEDLKLGSEDQNSGTSKLVQLYKTGESLIRTPELESDRLEKIVKGESQDYWWVYALVLSLLGVFALLYYYI